MGESGNVVRSSALMLIANFVAFAGGAFYWFLMARIVGLGELGLGSGVVSAAGIGGALLGGGFGLALARMVAEEPSYAACAMAASLVLSFAAAALGALLGLALGGVSVPLWAFILGLVGTMSMFGAQLLIGLGGFRILAIAQAVGSSAKVVAGVVLGIAGYGAAAVLAGYVLHPLAIIAAAVLYAGLACSLRGVVEVLTSVASLGFSNMVYVAGNQLTQSLGVYLYAIATGDREETGLLYIGFMLALVAAMPAGSVAAAALHHSVRERRELALSSAPLGLLASALAASALASAAPLALKLLGAEAASASILALKLLSISGPLLGLLNMVVSELNRRREASLLGLVAATRLAVIIVLFPVLARLMGPEGAAMAFLASTAAAALAAGRADARVPRLAVRAALAALPGLLVPPSVSVVAATGLGVLASLVLGHFLLYPVPDGVRVIRGALAGRG